MKGYERKVLAGAEHLYLCVLCLVSSCLFAWEWIGGIGVDRLAHSKHGICTFFRDTTA